MILFNLSIQSNLDAGVGVVYCS